MHNITVKILYTFNLNTVSKKKSNNAKVLIVDDNVNFRSGYIEYLNYQTDLNIVGEAKDGFEALKLIERVKPDIIFMDISMPRMDGLTAAHLIKQKYPEIKIIIITIHEKQVFKEIAQALPVDGFISKSSISVELPRVLKKLEVFSNVEIE